MSDFAYSVIARELSKMVREKILTAEVAQEACKKREGFIWTFAQERLQKRLDEARNKPRVESSSRVNFEIHRLAHGNYLQVGKIKKDGKSWGIMLPMKTTVQRAARPYPVTEAGLVPVCLVFNE